MTHPIWASARHAALNRDKGACRAPAWTLTEAADRLGTTAGCLRQLFARGVAEPPAPVIRAGGYSAPNRQYYPSDKLKLWWARVPPEMRSRD